MTDNNQNPKDTNKASEPVKEAVTPTEAVVEKKTDIKTKLNNARASIKSMRDNVKGKITSATTTTQAAKSTMGTKASDVIETGKAIYGVAEPFLKVAGRAIVGTAKGVRWATTTVDKSGRRRASKLKLGAIFAAVFIAPVTTKVIYMESTVQSGRFLITKTTDLAENVSRLNGCFKSSADQKTCSAEDTQMILVKPRSIFGLNDYFIPTTKYGLKPWGFENEVGNIPTVGECDLVTKGDFLLRGVLQPVVVDVVKPENCSHFLINNSQNTIEDTTKTVANTVKYKGHKFG